MSPRAQLIGKASLASFGGIIGAGIFGLPAMFAKVGFWPGTILYWALAATMLLTHLLIVEAILATPEKLRLPGMARKWVGNWAFILATGTYLLQVVGISFVYILLGGEFLSSLARMVGLGGPVFFWQIAFWVGAAATVFVGLKFVAKVATVTGSLLIGTLLLAIGLFLSRMPAGAWHVGGDGTAFLMPFGVFLFSLSGMNILGEVAEIAERNRRNVRAAVMFGTLGAACLCWTFGVVVAASSGGSLGNKAQDIVQLLPFAWAWIIPVIGFLSVSTAYIGTAQDMKAQLVLDLKLPKRMAWAVALGIPMLLLFFVATDFLRATGLIGTFLTGMNGMLSALVALCVARIKGGSWRMVAAGYLVIAVFAFGMLQRYFLQ